MPLPLSGGFPPSRRRHPLAFQACLFLREEADTFEAAAGVCQALGVCVLCWLDERKGGEGAILLFDKAASGFITLSVSTAWFQCRPEPGECLSGVKVGEDDFLGIPRGPVLKKHHMLCVCVSVCVHVQTSITEEERFPIMHRIHPARYLSGLRVESACAPADPSSEPAAC